MSIWLKRLAGAATGGAAGFLMHYFFGCAGSA